jgi:hypothetical protein
VLNPYEPGTCQSLLKWKPSNMNSIDFRVKTVRIRARARVRVRDRARVRVRVRVRVRRTSES